MTLYRISNADSSGGHPSHIHLTSSEITGAELDWIKPLRLLIAGLPREYLNVIYLTFPAVAETSDEKHEIATQRSPRIVQLLNELSGASGWQFREASKNDSPAVASVIESENRQLGYMLDDGGRNRTAFYEKMRKKYSTYIVANHSDE